MAKSTVPVRFWTTLGLVAIACAVYWPSVSALYDAWTDFSGLGYTHGPVVAVVSIGLLWRRRRELESVRVGPWPLAFGGLLLGSLAWLICYRASIQDLHVALFPGIIALAVAAAFGPSGLRIVAIPIFFFCFASSAWSQFAPVLQAVTLIVMRCLMPLTGMTATITGDVIQTPFGNFMIETDCSGLHFFLVGLAVATLHGELRDDPLRLRIKHIVVMTFLALLSNWVRVYTVVRAGYETHMRHVLVSRGHYYFGWALFVIALAGFFWLARRYSRREENRIAGVPGASPIAPRESPVVATGANGVGIAAVAAALSMVAVPALSFSVRWAQGMPLAPRVEFAQLENWAGPYLAEGSTWKPVFAGADALAQRRYQDSSGVLEAFGVAYATQRQGAELVGEASSITGENGMQIDGEGRVHTGVGLFRETSVSGPDGQKSVIWWRYEIGGRPITLSLAAQLWYGLIAVGAEPGADVVALRAQCLPDCAHARRRLEEVVVRIPVHVRRDPLVEPGAHRAGL